MKLRYFSFWCKTCACVFVQYVIHSYRLSNCIDTRLAVERKCIINYNNYPEFLQQMARSIYICISLSLYETTTTSSNLTTTTKNREKSYHTSTRREIKVWMKIKIIIIIICMWIVSSIIYTSYYMLLAKCILFVVSKDV